MNSQDYAILQKFTIMESTIIIINNETNYKFYRKVEFLMYTEMVNFRLRILASNQKPHRGLGTRLPHRDNGHVSRDFINI